MRVGYLRVLAQLILAPRPTLEPPPTQAHPRIQEHQLILFEMPIEEREYGKLCGQVEYLVKCCDDMKKDMDGIKTRNTTILTSVILLLLGVVINVILTYVR